MTNVCRMENKSSSGWESGVLRVCLTMLIILANLVSILGQSTSQDYQVGTILAVAAHKGSGEQASDSSRYDVTVKVSNTTYVVLYAPPNGSTAVKLVSGIDVLVLIGGDTATFNLAQSGKTEVPILSRTTVDPGKIDSSKVCSNYFTVKLRRLSEELSLTHDQLAGIKPILEQEAAEVGQICFNTTLSAGDMLKRYNKILKASDEKIRPLLSARQSLKLQDLRRDQKQDVKRIIAEQKARTIN
jgi:hypothetical protein